MSGDYRVRIRKVSPSWSWYVVVEPPGYPHARMMSRSTVCMTQKGARRWADRAVRRMERDRQAGKHDIEFTVSP